MENNTLSVKTDHVTYHRKAQSFITDYSILAILPV